MSNTTIEGQAKQIYTPIGESVYSFLVKKSHNRAHMPALIQSVESLPLN